VIDTDMQVQLRAPIRRRFRQREFAGMKDKGMLSSPRGRGGEGAGLLARRISAAKPVARDSARRD
jgi:hypothetical protein